MIDMLYIAPAITFLIGALCMFLYNRSSRKTDVWFFPDAKLPCTSFYKQMLGDPGFRCRRPRCDYAHNNENEYTSLMEIVSCLSKATRKVDLCVFDFTQFNLADFLISLKRHGVAVRIITDAHRDRRQQGDKGGEAGGDQKKQGLNDQIPRLQGSGIQVRVNTAEGDDRGLMHNKFVLIDDSHLIMGSFNWTHSAVVRNHEAVISTNESRVVRKFVRRFEHIWNSAENRQREIPEVRVR